MYTPTARHGAGGYRGNIVALGTQPPCTPSVVARHGAEHSPGYYFRVITNGQERIPSNAAELSVMERWAVTTYLTRVLQQSHVLSAR